MKLRLSNNAGELLTQTVQEVVFTDFSFEKGVKLVKESLHGIDFDLILQIIKGEKVITIVNENNIQYFDVVDNNNLQFSIREFYINKYNEVFEQGKYLYEKLNILLYDLKNNEYITNEIKLIDIIQNKYLNKIENNISNITSFIKSCKKYLKQSQKVLNLFKSLLTYYEFDLLNDNYDSVNDIILYNRPSTFELVAIQLQKVLNNDYNNKCLIFDENNIFFDKDYEEWYEKLIKNKFIQINCYESKIIQYIDLDKFNKELNIKDNIEICNILDNYTAGWISPNGDYYGMNGNQNDLLHNKIADLLKSQNIIQIDLNLNTDRYLMENSWCRIHGNFILFEGQEITKNQFNKIYDYSIKCHNEKLKFINTEITLRTFKYLYENDYYTFKNLFKL